MSRGRGNWRRNARIWGRLARSAGVAAPTRSVDLIQFHIAHAIARVEEAAIARFVVPRAGTVPYWAFGGSKRSRNANCCVSPWAAVGNGKPRILQLVDSAGMYGAESVILTLLKELKDSPFQGVLGYVQEQAHALPVIAKRAEELGIATVGFTMGRGLSIGDVVGMRRYIQRNDIWISHSHGYKTDILLGLLPRDKTKLLSTVHGWSIGAMTPKLRLYEALDTLALRRFDSVVAVSQAVENRLAQRIPRRMLQVIHNGIAVTTNDTAQRGDFKKVLGVPMDQKVVGYLGRLVPVKGPGYLLEAMRELIVRGDYWLLIAGEGPLRPALEEQARSLGISNRLMFLGYVEDIDRFLSALDLLVMPSLSEGLPMALLEAALRQVPIVASHVGGIPEIIENGRSGLLVPPRDSRALANAMMEVLSDEKRAERIAAAARETVVTEFAASTMARGYCSIYARLVDERNHESQA